ncbi:hypothetical protein F6Y24_21405 [Xanthomonas arboricola pv. pruni]|nr:hypothetical protein F6Y24_21405 [Xanthomonas arboricola pv. pruni]RST73281.1 hypothetical protein EJK96_02845 [Xanthomonas arboricola pv. pruni]RST75898.1 hypothetical protein EJL05_17970 [Xanthomonas arboricola pv. pruni]
MAMGDAPETMVASIARLQSPGLQPLRRRVPQMGPCPALDKRNHPQAVQMLAPARPQPVNSQTIQSRYGEDKS